MEKLENKRMLAADVYGPPIPEGHVYPEPIKLDVEARIPDVLESYIGQLPLLTPEAQDISHLHPAPGDPIIDGDYVWDTELEDSFANYASDGEITVLEAHNLITSTQTDDGFISRFEKFQLWRYIYRPENQDVWNIYAKTFALYTTTYIPQVHEDLVGDWPVDDWIVWQDADITAAASLWYWALKEPIDEPEIDDGVLDNSEDDGII